MSACAGGFLRPAGIVQPDVHALHEVAAHVDVVIFDEDEAIPELAVAHQLRDLLQNSFAGLVERMGFAGEDELHGTLRIVHHGGELLDIGEDQVGALVRGESPRKSDRERIGTENIGKFLAHFFRFAAAFGRLDGAATHKLKQLGFQADVRLPQLAVIYVLNSFPEFCLPAAFVPAGSQMAIVEPEHLRREPRRHVDAIGDVADRQRALKLPAIESPPHGAGDVAMQRRDGVGMPRELQPDHRHAEILVLVSGVFAPQSHQPVVVNTQLLAQRA